MSNGNDPKLLNRASWRPFKVRHWHDHGGEGICVDFARKIFGVSVDLHLVFHKGDVTWPSTKRSRRL